MRSIRTSLAAALVGLALVSAVAVAAIVSPDLNGIWNFSVVTENGTGTPTVVIKQEGEKITGTYESRMMGVRAIQGTVKGDSVRFALGTNGDPDAIVMTFMGVIIDDDNLKGTVDFAGMGGADFTATRKK